MATKQVNRVLIVLWLLLDVVCAICTRNNVKVILFNCNNHLVAISSAILETMDNNFTTACSHYRSYVQCAEPQLVDCEVRKTEEFWTEKYRYQLPPYNCTAPLFPGNPLLLAAERVNSSLGGATSPVVTSGLHRPRGDSTVVMATTILVAGFLSRL